MSLKSLWESIKKWLCRAFGWYCPPKEYVKVNTCLDSRMVGTKWCLNKEVIKYEKGKEPTEECTTHTTVSILAIDSCYDIMTAEGDWEKWLETIATTGANGVRFFAVQTWGQPKDKWHPFQPYPVVGEIADRNLPKFSLSDWNKDWWQKYRVILMKMKTEELTAHIVAEDYCSLKMGGNDKYKNPFIGSEEAMGPSTPDGVWGEAMKPYHLALFRKLIEEAKRVGVKFTFEVMNEYDAKDWPDDFMIAWHQWAVEECFVLGAHVIIASAMRNMKDIREQVDIYSAHGFVRPEKIDDFYLKYGRQGFLISGDGGFDGGGRCDKKGRRGSSKGQARLIAQKIYQYGYMGHERFDRALYWKDNDRANLDDYDPSVMTAFIDECRTIEHLG